MALRSPDALDAGKFEDESHRIAQLLNTPAMDAAERRAAAAAARDIVLRARAETRQSGLMESFLEEFGLSNPEGLALMCLAEASLRVPDAEHGRRADRGKISTGDWGDHNGKSDLLLVNASTWGPMLTGRRRPDRRRTPSSNPAGFIGLRVWCVRQKGEPVIQAPSMMRGDGASWAASS